MDHETSPPQYSLTRDTSSSMAASTASRVIPCTPSMVSSALRVLEVDLARSDRRQVQRRESPFCHDQDVLRI